MHSASMASRGVEVGRPRHALVEDEQGVEEQAAGRAAARAMATASSDSAGPPRRPLRSSACRDRIRARAAGSSANAIRARAQRSSVSSSYSPTPGGGRGERGDRAEVATPEPRLIAASPAASEIRRSWSVAPLSAQRAWPSAMSTSTRAEGIGVGVALDGGEPTLEVADGRARAHRLHREGHVGERGRGPGDRRSRPVAEGSGVDGERDEQRLVGGHRAGRRRAAELLDEQVPALLVDPEAPNRPRPASRWAAITSR